MLRWAMTLTGLLLAAGPLLACSLCGQDIQQRTTLRLEAGLPQARLILVGTVQSSVIADDKTGRGTTKFQVTSILKKDSTVAEPKIVEVPEYVPNANAQFLLYCDISSGKIDPYRRIVITNGDKSIDYVRKSLALDPKDRTAALQFYSEHFEDADREIAADAFLEFAKATDAEVGQVASKLDAAKLRRILSDPKTPPERLSVYAALLGACGTAEDSTFLARCLDDVRNDRIINAYDGFLGGYISLSPNEGWKRAEKILADKNQSSLPIRLSVMRTLRYQMGAHADRRADVLRCSETVLRQGDLADIAIEDLRRWKVWDRTPQVLAQYERKDMKVPPVVKEAVVRFAIQASPTQPGAQTFLADRERLEPELVRTVRESLKYQPE